MTTTAVIRIASRKLTKAFEESITLRKPAAAKRMRQTLWIDARGATRPSRFRVRYQKYETRMNSRASAPAGSSPDAAAVPTPADPLFEDDVLARSMLERSTMVARTKF